MLVCRGYCPDHAWSSPTTSDAFAVDLIQTRIRGLMTSHSRALQGTARCVGGQPHFRPPAMEIEAEEIFRRAGPCPNRSCPREGQGLIILLQGPAGSGKTSTAVTIVAQAAGLRQQHNKWSTRNKRHHRFARRRSRSAADRHAGLGDAGKTGRVGRGRRQERTSAELALGE